MSHASSADKTSLRTTQSRPLNISTEVVELNKGDDCAVVRLPIERDTAYYPPRLRIDTTGLEMNRVRFIEYRGTRILLSDLSGIDTSGELQRTLRLGSELIQTQPPGSLLILVDVSGLEYTLESFAIVQQAVAANRPYVRARAVVGLPKIAALPFSVVAKVSGRPMAKFDDVEAAKDWLVAQGSG